MRDKRKRQLFIKSIVAGLILLVHNFIGLLLTIRFFPFLAEQYFSPAFDMEGYKGILFLLHPFVLSFSLALFWEMFKKLLSGSFWLKGIQLGLVYGAISVLPSMWMILSAFDVAIILVVTWLVHGVIQGTIVGLVYAKMEL